MKHETESAHSLRIPLSFLVDYDVKRYRQIAALQKTKCVKEEIRKFEKMVSNKSCLFQFQNEATMLLKMFKKNVDIIYNLTLEKEQWSGSSNTIYKIRINNPREHFFSDCSCM